ncbi:TTAGGG repeat binding factor [Arthrobotrys conoides]|uniref:TTAGGG repeat binding factor n=1 Tax=Arthrobotrys conoides TaxID=74498 RepID=A0AAN8RU67_9PEZI
MARKAGHQKLPSPEIPKGSSTAIRTRSRRSPLPSFKDILVIDNTEDEGEGVEEGEEGVEARSQQSEEGEEEEGNEDAREGTGEDINLQVDDNTQEGSLGSSSQEDVGSDAGRFKENHEDGASMYDDGKSSQSRFDPSLILANIELLDDAASNVLDYFLRSTKEGDHLDRTALADVMALYKACDEDRVINPLRIASILEIDHYENGVDKIFDPIFRKANLAAFSLIALHSEPPSYYALGGWGRELASASCYDGVDDTTNFDFVKELRTQAYIRGVGLQHQIKEKEHPNWPDRILLGVFCIDMPPDDLPFERTSTFKQKLKATKLTGWDSEDGSFKELKGAFQKDLMDHITLLRTYTENVDGTPTADLDGLTENYPYEDFQDKYLEWLKKAYHQISQSSPSIHWLRETSKRLAKDFENFHEIFEQCMRETQENPGSRSPSMIQPSRRTTGTSIGGKEILAEPPQNSLPAVSSSKHLDSATRSRLIKVKESARAAGKPIFRSSTGLTLPTSSQPQPSKSQDKIRDRRSAPSTFGGGSGMGFDINKSLAKAARQEEKENTKPPTREGGKGRRYNETQEGRSTVNFSDDNNASARLTPPQPVVETTPIHEEGEKEEEAAAEAAAEAGGPSFAEEEGGKSGGDDESIGCPDPGPSKQNKRPHVSSDDEDELSDDYAINNKNAGIRKKPRYGDVVIKTRARRFEPSKGASHPETQRTSFPPQPRFSQDDSSDSSQKERRETSEDSERPVRHYERPKPRGAWSKPEVQILIKAVGEIGTRWSTIRDNYFDGSRVDGQLKDKARNLKLQYLKSGKKLPHNFEHVTFGEKMMKELKKFGLRYRDGDTRATRILPSK